MGSYRSGTDTQAHIEGKLVIRLLNDQHSIQGRWLMAKVYVSSTLLGLKAERQAVLDWLIAAEHQPVHSYVPDSETVRESCLEDVGGCDIYVLILGHRYGYQPERDN